MANEEPGQTLQAIALAHEAYLPLVDVENAQHWNSHGPFCGAAAEAMRRILVEKARQRLGPTRDGGLNQVKLDDALDIAGLHADEVLRVIAPSMI